jgi:integral membrane sensor domain MASE1
VADARILAGALSAVAGLIHVQATVDHAGEYWLFGVLFGVVALAQIGLAVALWRARVPDGVLVASAVVTLGVVAVWLVSRTVGLPIGPSAGTAERVGVSDTMAAFAELVFVALASAIVRPDGRVGRHLAWLEGGNAVRLGVTLGSAGVLAALFGNHGH